MDRLRECRQKANLSQKYVALSLGIAEPSVSNWERGKTRPSNENIAKLADLYGVSVDYLLGRTDDPNNVSTKLESLGKQLTAASKSKEWRMLSEGLEEFERKRNAEFQMVFKFLTTSYPEIFKERTDDDDTEP